MKTTIFLAALVLPAGVLLVGCGGIDFGIGPGAPIGTLAAMDKVLVEKGLEKKPTRIFTEGECFGPEIYEKLVDFKVYEYQEHAKQVAGAKFQVVIAVDDTGSVRAVHGGFHSGAPGFTTSGGRTQKFMASLWLEIAGYEPKFTKENRPGGDVAEYLLTTLSKGDVKGRWEKIPPSDMLGGHRQLYDRILLWRE